MMTKEVENPVGSLGTLESVRAEGKSGETSDYFYQSALNPGSWGPSRQILKPPTQYLLKATSSLFSRRSD